MPEILKVCMDIDTRAAVRQAHAIIEELYRRGEYEVNCSGMMRIQTESTLDGLTDLIGLINAANLSAMRGEEY